MNRAIFHALSKRQAAAVWLLLQLVKALWLPCLGVDSGSSTAQHDGFITVTQSDDETLDLKRSEKRAVWLNKAFDQQQQQHHNIPSRLLRQQLWGLFVYEECSA